MAKSVVIIGGGASGVLLATAIINASQTTRVSIIEKRQQLGPGVAYSTVCSAHLLNVQASKMSAFPQFPDHFTEWLEQRYPGKFGPRSFVGRAIYGHYLCEIARETQGAAGERLVHHRTTATGVAQTPSGRVRVTCSNGGILEADALVLASGNATPARLPGVHLPSAWDPGALQPGPADDSIVLIGTGLTAVDAVLALRENGHRGKISMVSRRGLLPHEHRSDAVLHRAHTPGNNGDALLRLARSLKSTGRKHWRARVDALRPLTNAMWRAAAVREQQVFLRRLMPYWNVHRHRMAPEVARELARLFADGTLEIVAGRIGSIERHGGRLHVPVRSNSSAGTRVIEATRAVNCTGPMHDYRKTDDPIFRSLLHTGELTVTDHGTGIAVSGDGAVLTRGGVPSQRIFAIGPTRFGADIETMAMPEIRVQAVELASQLARATA